MAREHGRGNAHQVQDTEVGSTTAMAEYYSAM